MTKLPTMTKALTFFRRSGRFSWTPRFADVACLQGALAIALIVGCANSDDGLDNRRMDTQTEDDTTHDEATETTEGNHLDEDAESVSDGTPPLVPIPASDQRIGDPAIGYQVLVNEPYVSCGIPSRIFGQFFGEAPDFSKLPGRNELNQDRRYYETAFIDESGVEVTGTNCLQCHAEYLDGRVYVGLGDTTFDYTQDTAAPARALLAYAQDADPSERAILDKWAQRVQTIAPYVRTATVGVNPADSLTEVLLAHRHRDTLAWSEEPLLEMEAPYAIPVSVPPWWFMKKKNAMFYTGSGRGDHSRFMMSASTLCTDSVEEAAAIDAMFPDVRAYILSIESPPYTRPINASQATAGKALFEEHCSGCHGTYGENETYPNLLVHIDTVGTDPFLSRSAFNAKLEFFDWYNESFYGEAAVAVPTTGYVAPPLDGVWVTAPYLHNGSVPSLMGVILPHHRPTFWTRDYTTYQVNELDGGLLYETLSEEDVNNLGNSQRSLVYNTTQQGYGNAGHDFGSALNEDDARLIIEYLKTL